VVLVRGDAEVASWPLARTGRIDLAVVEALARLQLSARRLGCSIRVRDACASLLELLALAGLGDVVPCVPALGVQAGGQPEGGEQAGVDEVVVPDDPVA
jgi:hypothetical protein